MGPIDPAGGGLLSSSLCDHLWTVGDCLCIRCGIPYCLIDDSTYGIKGENCQKYFSCRINRENCQKYFWFKILGGDIGKRKMRR